MRLSDFDLLIFDEVNAVFPEHPFHSIVNFHYFNAALERLPLIIGLIPYDSLHAKELSTIDQYSFKMMLANMLNAHYLLLSHEEAC